MAVIPKTIRLASRRGRAASTSRADATIGPFVKRFESPAPPLDLERQHGNLRGAGLGVKDLFGVRGHVSGFGSPAYRRAFPAPAAADSDCVGILREHGMHIMGMLHMDECAYSLQGENEHFGTPTNGKAPLRVPGGSSSGCGSAVSMLNEVQLALGSDTAGSVRGVSIKYASFITPTVIRSLSVFLSLCAHLLGIKC